MKLSKDFLMVAFHLAIQHFSKNLKSYFNRQSFTDVELREMFDKFAAALEDGTLEIEGYERVQWTRFAPKDPMSFPPVATQVLFCEVCFDVRDRELRKIISAGWHNPQNHLFWKGEFPVKHEDVTHWRPLPKPPQESEACK